MHSPMIVIDIVYMVTKMLSFRAQNVILAFKLLKKDRREKDGLQKTSPSPISNKIKWSRISGLSREQLRGIKIQLKTYLKDIQFFNE